MLIGSGSGHYGDNAEDEKEGNFFDWSINGGIDDEDSIDIEKKPQTSPKPELTTPQIITTSKASLSFDKIATKHDGGTPVDTANVTLPNEIMTNTGNKIILKYGTHF